MLFLWISASVLPVAQGAKRFQARKLSSMHLGPNGSPLVLATLCTDAGQEPAKVLTASDEVLFRSAVAKLSDYGTLGSSEPLIYLPAARQSNKFVWVNADGTFSSPFCTETGSAIGDQYVNWKAGQPTMTGGFIQTTGAGWIAVDGSSAFEYIVCAYDDGVEPRNSDSSDSQPEKKAKIPTWAFAVIAVAAVIVVVVVVAVLVVCCCGCCECCGCFASGKRRRSRDADEGEENERELGEGTSAVQQRSFGSAATTKAPVVPLTSRQPDNSSSDSDSGDEGEGTPPDPVIKGKAGLNPLAAAPADRGTTAKPKLSVAAVSALPNLSDDAPTAIQRQQSVLSHMSRGLSLNESVRLHELRHKQTSERCFGEFIEQNDNGLLESGSSGSSDSDS